MPELKMEFHRQSSLTGEIVAFWAAYLNIRCTEMTCQLCIKEVEDFAASGNPEVDTAC